MALLALPRASGPKGSRAAMSRETGDLRKNLPSTPEYTRGRGEGTATKESLGYQSTPSIRQLSPLPIPKSATRSPVERMSRSSAKAAVSGSETVPMFPRNS